MREDVVAAARLWLGTPYRHQASCRGAGADCLGLIRGVWRDLCGPEPEAPPAYTPDWGETGRQEVLWSAATRHLIPLAASPLDASPLGSGLLATGLLATGLPEPGLPEPGLPEPGDVLLFRLRTGGIAKHLGIAAETGAAPTFIHAYSGHAVVESPLSEPWARRIVARFGYPKGAI
ncbi:peptidase [Haematobacter genomosp. 1]|uniref:Peptidase n=1 Tax=Haematobacter genomosp. 1 TaxID=366618 RepID=A0A212AD73_9RHOB|nr:peptidase [Haematobacter genomosp. 1]OWJ78959.1 peptidase [Haematobacter genomosp. 1]